MDQEKIDKTIFYEKQQFRQIWIWLILILILLILLIPIISGVFGIFLNIILLTIGYCFIWLFYSMKLITEIKKDGIQITFTPFTNFIIPFNKIRSYKIRKYRPILEYGGWGIRFNRTGKAYTVSGKIGLQIELSNGKEILIGTENPDKLLQSLNKLPQHL
tara:strand:+ start:167 stop:646 length:480 start_codon:yes stop_codon:yes gene_type:complete